MSRPRRTVADVAGIRHALVMLRTAVFDLRDSGAPRAADKARRALKSAEGALRHAEGAVAHDELVRRAKLRAGGR